MKQNKYLGKQRLQQQQGTHTDADNQMLKRIGYLITAVSVLFGLFFFFVVFVSNWHPFSGLPIVIKIQDNLYYILLAPVLVPTLIGFSWVNWMGMQSFRRN